MDPISADQIAFDFPNLFRIYKDGRIDRFDGTEIITPFTDPKTGVQSKDIIISPETGLSARVFLPRVLTPARRLPLLVFIHGGAFCIQTPFSRIYHGHVSALAAMSDVVAVSVHYRRAPEHPLPIAFEDSWAAIEYIAAHRDGAGPEAWLNDHADLGRVFVAGDSAGGTLAHYVARRAGVDGLGGLRIVGLVAIHPFFHTDGARSDELLDIIFPTIAGSGDPRVDPSRDPDLGRLGCEKVLICVAEKDSLRERGWAYYEALKNSGWAGNLEVFESQGEDHVFHLFNPTCDNAVAFMDKVASFLKDE